jgi:hypothetical protein
MGEMMTEIICINSNEEVPKGWKYLSSFECEKLLCNNFELFKDLELSVEVGYYLLKNINGTRYLWLRWLGNNSDIDGNLRVLSNDFRVRGVLVIKKEVE